ncbi:hypothetical protein JZ751_027947 [Albula glossodonta]|uniref:Uncharacterized protein n=1 Tax=Albula glossodonta TaxID=121402 RepID=A0A8T2PIP3_9TELE|nr:hypothetical protein JZ751_027947 [Albula glossodonta]
MAFLEPVIPHTELPQKDFVLKQNRLCKVREQRMGKTGSSENKRSQLKRILSLKQWAQLAVWDEDTVHEHKVIQSRVCGHKERQFRAQDRAPGPKPCTYHHKAFTP